MTLQQYLTSESKRGVIDHALRAHVRPDGSVAFYIHPAHVDGPTKDFVTFEAAVVPLDTTPPPAAALAMVPQAKKAA